jgi:hypothetical protein
MRAVCPTCQLSYRCHRGGVDVVEVIGREQKPYKLWQADLYKCPGCGHEIVTAFGEGPFATDWQENFAETVALVESLPAAGPFYSREFPKQ